ncbi:hypothetical protein R77569_01463 [Ralstonia mannitolilytica]|uniref:Uncharacterized protein n=1 Tax=Ralstonia mannitolilytica TaxID=105219 RepID=A0ABN9K0D5_9RALS|nr:hypothetical protein [Ralstonia mannitolilytica]CAJ0861749.1 hypothetical protein R77569_01463 [Ralstonia mannitolilytica]
MATHDAWALACRLFAGGTPILRAALSPREIAALPALGQAVKPTALDQRFVLCPYCHQHRAQVWGNGHQGRTSHCPECGPVDVAADDMAALALDEDWLRRKLRLALSIESRDGIDALGDGVWRLGDSRCSPVLLARDLIRLWREPALLDRVRVAGGPIRVITPKPRETRGAPFGPAVEWLALEDRFAFYGGGISFIAPTGEPPAPQASDPTTPVKGPFSADFRWVTLPDWPHGPIRLTEAQAAVFDALWSFKGEPRTADQIMRRAGLNSDKPIDVFKVKTRDKGKPEAEGPLVAYRALVQVVQGRPGLYSMPCAAALSPVQA